MIKIDIVKRIADELNLKDREALSVVDTIIDSFKQTLKESGRIEIRNFGVFQVKQRKPRTGRNPRNKKEYPIHPRKVVTFKLGKELKDFSVEAAEAGNPPEGEAQIQSRPPRTEESATPQSSVEQVSFLPNAEENTSPEIKREPDLQSEEEGLYRERE